MLLIVISAGDKICGSIAASKLYGRLQNRIRGGYDVPHRFTTYYFLKEMTTRKVPEGSISIKEQHLHCNHKHVCVILISVITLVVNL